MAATFTARSNGMSQRPSRWDAIRRDDDAARPSTSTSFSSSARRRQKPPNSGNNFRPRQPTAREKGDRGGSDSLRSGTSVGTNWRRRAANDAVDCSPKLTAQEEEVTKSMKKLQISITSFINKTEDETVSREVEETVRHSIEQLSYSLFDVTDTTHMHAEQPSLRLDSTTRIVEISNAVIWDAGYSLLLHLKLLSQSQQRREECCNFILRMSSITLLCLQSLIHNQQHFQEERVARPKGMTDLRLCECASNLLDTLASDFLSLPDIEMNTNNILLCKANVFSCLAKVLVISTMNAWESPPGTKNAKGKGPLFLWGAEKTVNLIVKESALPFLELITKADDTATSASMKVSYCYGAIECLYLLLKDPSMELSLEWTDEKVTNNKTQLSRHAAAILAPLVVDVLPDGKENQRANPLRKRTMRAISYFWEWSYESIEKGKQSSVDARDQRIVLISCQSMAAALNALSALRKNKAQSAQIDSYEIDVSNVAHILQSMIQNEGLRSHRTHFLHILAQLSMAYPNACARQWHLFLEQSTVKESPLLSMLEDGTSAVAKENFDDSSWIALPSALCAMFSLITIMPFQLWISGEGRQSMRMSGGNLSSRVQNAFLNLLRSTYNLMEALNCKISSSYEHASMEIVMGQVSDLAGKLCTVISFNGDNSVLLQPASRIVQSAGDIYVHSVKSIANQPYEYTSKSELEQTLRYKAMSNFGNVIIESLGAGASSSAKITSSSTPAQHWLSDASSFDFIGLLLTDSCWVYPLSRDRMEMLAALAKLSPLTLSREPFNLASFCELCSTHCTDENDAESRILGLKLIESFILGRKTTISECTTNNTLFSVIPGTFCPLLLAALEDHSSAVRACAVSSFGSLMKQDWIGLLLSSADHDDGISIDWSALKSILRLCSATGENTASVRASSCKAIGDICSTCIDGTDYRKEDYPNHEGIFSNEFAVAFTCNVCDVMATSLHDNNASVRSMALFAVGNIALALKERYRERPTHALFPSMKQLFPSVCECLEDRDEKVIANAIRSISHTAYFAFHPGYVSKLDDDASALLDVYATLLSKLSAKINLALDDAVGDSPKGLTWKQRNGAKKHAWGSCTTLGMLLNFSNMLLDLDTTLLELAISSLFRCIQFSHIIHEKITVAAITALAGLPISLWKHISCKCDSIGRGLATCFGILSGRQSNTAYYHDVESLANLLLPTAKKTDFCTLFLLNESIPFSVEFFYQWLVAHDCEAGVLEEIADAVSSQNVAEILDVSVTQMFLSRSIQQHKLQGSPCKVNDASLLLDENDDDEL